MLIISMILAVFISVAAITPWLFIAYNQQPSNFVTSSWVTANNVTSIASSAVSDNTGTDVFSWIFQVMQTVGYYFFTMLALISPWNFGILPAWLSLIFNFMKLILVLTIARNVWIGGGG